MSASATLSSAPARSLLTGCEKSDGRSRSPSTERTTKRPWNTAALSAWEIARCRTEMRITKAPIDSSAAVETAKRRTRRGGRCTPEGFRRDFLSRGSGRRLNIEAAGPKTDYLWPLALPLFPWPFPCP